MGRRSCMRTMSLVVMCWSLGAGLVWAQGAWGLQNRGYYEPLIAEVRAANVNVQFWGQSDEFPFMQTPGRRRIWDIGLGKELGLFGYETGTGVLSLWPASAARATPMGCGCLDACELPCGRGLAGERRSGHADGVWVSGCL